MFVQNHMTPHPETIIPDASVTTAWEKMRDQQFHELPVVDGNQNLLGIVTDRDIRSAIGYDTSTRAELTVDEVMTPDPICVSPGAPIEDAINLFCEHHFGALPVMQGKQLVGILSRTDLLRAFHDLLGLEKPGTRIQVAIPHGAPDVARVMRSLTEEDEISSVVAARLRMDGTEPVLYIRTRSQKPQQLEQRLRSSGVTLLAREQAPTVGD